jgi:hypothetical protein
MIYSIAARQIVDRVNAQRGDAFQYRFKGTLTKWLSAHDQYVFLDALTLRVQFGPTGARESIADNREATPEDVERVTQQILGYFGGRSELKHAA